MKSEELLAACREDVQSDRDFCLLKEVHLIEIKLLEFLESVEAWPHF
jgi:hypothetical protein